jgi:predicted nucleotidyltransferase
MVREVAPERIILFGSRARDEAGPESDIDLLVVDSRAFGPDHSRWSELSKLWDLAARLRMPVDILLYSRDEVERWRDSRNHVIGRALREGRFLYDRR